MSEQHFTLNTDDKGVILIPNSILKDGEEMSEREVVELLNEQQATIEQLKQSQDVKEFSALFRQNLGLKKRLDYETRMHKRWKDDCLAILEEQDLNDYVKELQKNKKSGWDSEPNTDYITRVKEGLK